MTQENKNLLLKDISARLPYGVKVVIQDTFKYSIVSREYHVLDVSNFSDIFCFNYKQFDKRMKKAMRERPNDIVIKPYLFPLSSMTEKQMEELNGLCTMYIPERFNFDDYHPYAYKGIKVLYKHVDGNYKFDFKIDVIDWFNKNHFDYRGLIKKGLAIDATGLNIY